MRIRSALKLIVASLVLATSYAPSVSADDFLEQFKQARNPKANSSRIHLTSTPLFFEEEEKKEKDDKKISVDICPVDLLGIVEDFDVGMPPVCRFKTYRGTDCKGITYIVDLPCSVNEANCVEGKCDAPFNFTLYPVVVPDTSTPNPPPPLPSKENRYFTTEFKDGLEPPTRGGTRRFRPREGAVEKRGFTTIEVDRRDVWIAIIQVRYVIAGESKVFGVGYEIPGEIDEGDWKKLSEDLFTHKDALPPDVTDKSKTKVVTQYNSTDTMDRKEVFSYLVYLNR